MLGLFDEEKKELGSTLWGCYNALTHWSTHTDYKVERYNEETKKLETINGDISDFHAAILTLANEIRSTSPEQKNKKEVPLNPIPTPVEDSKEQRVDGIEETVRKNKNKNELVVNILDYLQERMETEKDEDDE